MTDDDSKPDSRVTGRSSIPKLLLTAAVSALFTVGAGYLTYRVTTHEPKLVYQLIEGPSLSSLGLTRRIYVIQVKNTGRREVEEFYAGLDYPTGRLEDLAVSRTAGLQVTERRDSISYEARAAFFNPTDTLSISFLASSASSETPSVVVRGRGILGRRQEQGVSRRDQGLLPALAAAAAASLLMPALFLVYVRSRGRALHLILPSRAALREANADDRRVVLGYALGRVGLGPLAEQVRLPNSEWQYREIADHLLFRARSVPADRPKAIAALAALLLAPQVSESSRSVVARAVRLLEAPAQVLDTRALDEASTPEQVRDAMDALISDLLPTE